MRATYKGGDVDNEDRDHARKKLDKRTIVL